MIHLREKSIDVVPRLYLVGILMLLAFSILVGTLFRLQVLNEVIYRDKQDQQSVRRVRLPGIRGRIFDRNGICIADNRPIYNIAVFLEEIRARTKSDTVKCAVEMGEIISKSIGRENTITEAAVRKHWSGQLSLPLVLCSDLNDLELARWAELSSTLQGADVYVTISRTYPYGETFAHSLGYVGRGNMDKDKENPYHYYLPEQVGRAGIESKFDPILRGQAGGLLLRIDVTGYRHDNLSVRDPQPGSDLKLTLDLRIQQLAEKALGGEPGAMVVVDAQSGDILALANAPTFDLNSFLPRISSANWNSLRNNPDNPMFNRAVAGAYPPGSTFKPVVALAALKIKPSEGVIERYCDGVHRVGKATFRCWKRSGHGPVTLSDTLKYSCNDFMYQMAEELGPEPILAQAKAMGFGKKTGIPVGYESPGLLPSDAWKRKRDGFGWSDGDTANLSIGQGFLLATPLQMARVTACIGNGGSMYKMRLIKGVRPPNSDFFEERPEIKTTQMDWLPGSLAVVRDGMRRVIMDRDGTGRKARIAGWDAAGKTGTAEYGAKGSGKKRGWMIGWLPFDNPKYAVACVVDNAAGGGSTVGPKMHTLFEGLYELNHEEK